MTETEVKKHFEENYEKYKVFASTVLKSVCIEHGFRLTPHEAEESVQIAMLQLYKCLFRYDSSRGIPFKNYVFLRVTGSFLDTQRSRSPIPRKQQKLYQKYLLYKAHCEKYGEIFSESECAKHLDVTTYELRTYIINWNSRNSVSLDDPDGFLEIENNDFNPEKTLLQTEAKSSILKSIDRLNEREQEIIKEIFFNDQSLASISEKMGISESRISQIKKQAIEKIKKHCI